MLEDQSSGVAGESAAAAPSSPNPGVSRSHSFVGHRRRDTQACIADDAGQATPREQTIRPAPDPQKFDGHVVGEAQVYAAVDTTLADDADALGLLRPGSDSSRKGRASRAVVQLMPMAQAPDSLNASGGDVGKDGVEQALKPSGAAPRPSKTRRARKAGVGDTGQRTRVDRSKAASIAPVSSSRREPGAGPASVDVFSKAALPDPQHPEIGGNAEARQAIQSVASTGIAPAAPNQSAGNGGGVDHGAGVDPALIAEIRMQWRMRQLWLSAEVKLTLQAKAFCRALAVEGDKKDADAIYKAALGIGTHPRAALAMAAMLPLLESRDGIERRRGDIEKHLDKLAKQLPVAGFIKATHGASLRGLAAIVGEAGDLSTYANPGKLWKRMGLAPHGGKAYATWRGVGGLTAQDWTDAGYSPRRRSAMYVIGGSLIGGMGKGKRPLVGQDLSETDWHPLERLFVERLRYEAERDPENMTRPVTAEGKESFSKWAAARAQRYVEKRFLRLLWQVWKGGAAAVDVGPGQATPLLPHFAEAVE